MVAIKLTRTVNSQILHIKELENFRGKTVEIIILAPDQSPRVASSPKQKKNAGGMLSKYKNVALIEQESHAWELAVKEKYANR